jgi:predicted dehydrogenase
VYIIKRTGNMVNRKINWGILATGKIASKFASDISLVEDAELHAVASRNVDRSKEFAKEFGVPKSYGSYQELVSDTEIDVVYIATPHVFHFENTLMCLEAGKHVLCEKPVGMNSVQLMKMIDVAREKNLFFMEALWTRFIPSYKKFRELVLGGVVGDIRLIQSDFGFKVSSNPKSRLINKDLGAGSLLDLGIYPVFLALDIAGKPEQIQASALMNSDGIDEICRVTFTYNHKKVLADLSSSIVINSPIESVIYGTKGFIRLNKWWHAPSSIDIEIDGKTEHFNFKESGFGYKYEIMELNECIKNGKTESDLFPLVNSVLLHNTLDTIRQKINLNYEADK